MLISRAWLAQLLQPGALDGIDDDALADAITLLGLEIEGVTRHGATLGEVVVGRVEDVQPHPDADKLRAVRVFDGRGTVPVVCGAPNVPAPGGLVAFAPVGTKLPGGLEIGARKIRGVQSEGMICSEDELEIGADDAGILVLPQDFSAGARLIDQVAGIEDTVFELSVTPNRPDALGHVGVAKDLAVKLGTSVRLPEPARAPTVETVDNLVTLSAPQRCGRYIGRVYENVRVGPSPLWLRVLLHRVGLRAINAVVDITNLVLMEWGQPLHAFDRARLTEGRVVVRQAEAGEVIETLDGQKLELHAEDLVIADAKRPQAVAGVIGGTDSGTEGDTTQLLLEAAWFEPTGVRRTARTHQLSTDSSHRFERGVDHGAHLDGAVARADALIVELTGASRTGMCEVGGTLPARPTIRLRPARSSLLLGMEIPDDEAKRVLQGLEVECEQTDTPAWLCRPPTHRPDLQREEDLIEELMRHHGLDQLPSRATVPSVIELEASPEVVHAHRRAALHEDLIDALRAVGLHEHFAFAFTSEDALRPFQDVTPLQRVVRVTNPMRAQTSVMRTHMLPGLLQAWAHNVSHHGRPIRLFEVGRVYAWPSERTGSSEESPTASIDRQLPAERSVAAVLLSDLGRGHEAEPDEAARGARELAGLVLAVVEQIGLSGRIVPVDGDGVSWLHPGVQGILQVFDPDDEAAESVEAGRLGEVHPDLAAAHDLPEGSRAFYAEIEVDRLPTPAPGHYDAIPRFPATSRDLSLVISDEAPAALVVDALLQAEAVHAHEADAGSDPARLAPGDHGSAPVEVLEEYRGKGVPAGHRAVLFRLHYRAQQRSVTDDEVQDTHRALVRAACRTLDLDPDEAVR